MTDIRVLAIGGPNGDVQRARDTEDAGQTEEHGASMSTAQCCRTHTLSEKKATGKTGASTWCLNLVPKLSGAKMISYKLTEYQRIMS